MLEEVIDRMIDKIKHFIFFNFSLMFDRFAKGYSLRNKYIILLYHQVGQEHEVFNSLSRISIGDFEKQIEFLSSRCRVIPLRKMIDYIREKKEGKDIFYSITFDDGYENNFSQALPILEKYNIPAVFFLATHFIEQPKAIPWWDKLEYITFNIRDTIIDEGQKFNLSIAKDRESFFQRKQKLIMQYYEDKDIIIDRLLKKYGITNMVESNRFVRWDFLKNIHSKLVDFGAHSCSHDITDRRHFESEIIQSRDQIEFQLKKRVELFSYPYGDKHTMIKLNQAAFLKRNGFFGAVTNQLGCNDNNSDVFLLNRVAIGPFCSQGLSFKNYLFFADKINFLNRALISYKQYA